MSNVDINVDGRTDGQKIGRLYRTLLQAGAINRFSRWPLWSHLGCPIGTILAIFELHVTPMLPSKFGVNWPFGSREKAKIDFQDGHLASYQVSSQLAQGCTRSRLLKQLLTPHDE